MTFRGTQGNPTRACTGLAFGLRLLDFWLDDDAPLRVAFLPQATHAQVVVFKSVR